jgi:O-acetyl-ADP-ribose deacetylase (regulator of RNase III)
MQYIRHYFILLRNTRLNFRPLQLVESQESNGSTSHSVIQLKTPMKIQVLKTDITTLEIEAIVNAANSSLLGGGGVDGAIHRSGGPEILEECMQIRARQGGCDTGQAVITTGGRLPAKYVIHTVGPVWRGDEATANVLLADCYANSLKLAVEKGIRSIAFPNISTGIYRFPKPEAARIAIHTVEAFEKPEALDLVIFACFDDENFELYQQLLSNG